MTTVTNKKSGDKLLHRAWFGLLGILISTNVGGICGVVMGAFMPLSPDEKFRLGAIGATAIGWLVGGLLGFFASPLFLWTTRSDAMITTGLKAGAVPVLLSALLGLTGNPFLCLIPFGVYCAALGIMKEKRDAAAASSTPETAESGR
jgi:cytochrome c biogenesis protein CcdA